MKKIDAMRNEILAATRSVDSIDLLGQQLVANQPEYRQHHRNGLSYADIGQSHLEEQLRVYFVYTLDREGWEQLAAKTERFSMLDRSAMAPIFSPWGYLHSDLVENIGVGLGWTPGSQPRNVEVMAFTTRMRLIDSMLENLTDAQLQKLDVSLGLEEGVAPAKQGCYVATAVYGSYDAPEVLVLRRWRDAKLKETVFGRKFIRLYYATSPHLVNAVGSRRWFVRPCRAGLDRFVRHLKRSGYAEALQQGE